MFPLLSSCSVEWSCPCPDSGKEYGTQADRPSTYRVSLAKGIGSEETQDWLNRLFQKSELQSCQARVMWVQSCGWPAYPPRSVWEWRTAQRQRQPRYGGSQTWHCWALAPAASDSDPSTDLRRIRTNTFSVMLQRTWVSCLSLATKSLANTNYFLVKRKIVRGYKMEPLTKF